MGISRGLLLCSILCIVEVIIQVHCQVPFCVFGSDSNCLLPCRCSSSCDRITGQCSDNQCAQDPFLKDQQLNGRTYWTGDACQTGDVGRGKHAEQLETYYNPGLKINATADQAVDGNLSTYAYSHTSTYGWWMVDLEVEHDIEEVYITANNLGNGLILLTNYSVWLGNDPDVFSHSLCGLAPSPLVPGYQYSTPVQWNRVVCNKEHRRGRYLSIRKTEGDSSKGWIPIHEAVIIGSPVTSVRLGYCVRYDEIYSDDLKNLKCEECAEGWLLPDCQHSDDNIVTGNLSSRAVHSTTSATTLSRQDSATVSSSTTSSTLRTSVTSTVSTVKTATNTVTDTFVVSSDYGESSVTIWVIIAGCFAVLGALLLVAVVVILVMCCRRRQFQKSRNVSPTNQGPIYFKPDHVKADTNADNYERLLRSKASPHAYAGVRPTNEEDGTRYQAIQLEGRPERYTNPIHDGHEQKIDRGSNTYNYADTFVDNGGYLKPIPSMKVGEKNEGYIELIGEQNVHNGEADIYHTIPDNGVNLSE